MKYCHNCGMRFGNDTIYCSGCGTKLLSSPDKELIDEAVDTLKKRETISGVLWGAQAVFLIIFGIANASPLFFLGALHGINCILALDRTKRIAPPLDGVVEFYNNRLGWLIACSVLTMVFSAFIPIFIAPIVFDFFTRNLVLKNRHVYH